MAPSADSLLLHKHSQVSPVSILTHLLGHCTSYVAVIQRHTPAHAGSAGFLLSPAPPEADSWAAGPGLCARARVTPGALVSDPQRGWKERTGQKLGTD